MTLRIGWLTPFNHRTGVGTFSKAVTDAMPERHGARQIDLTIIAPFVDGLYASRHRMIDIASTSAHSRFYELFDVLVFNIGNNDEHHQHIFDVMRHYPGVVICHDYVYQHFLARIVGERGSGFADYVALFARYGSPDALRRVRQSNITRGRGLFYAVWDSDLSAAEPLGAPVFQLGSALVVHSAYAEAYAAPRFDGPVLRLGMPHDQRPSQARPSPVPNDRSRRTIVSFGHVQPTKCIDDVLLAIASLPRLREEIRYVISGFSGPKAYLDRLAALVHEHALERCVRFALDLTDAELETLGAEADAFVNLRCPNTEGASVSLIEQLVTGKPVMVFDTGCYAELPNDAVIKVARPRDIAAIAEAMSRLLGDRTDLDAIGARGRAYAQRIDCSGYAARLLDFVTAEEVLLRRRASARATCLIDIERPDMVEEAADDAWGEALATARTTFDLLDQGRLALDPTLIGSLGSDRIADYVQAAILRRGTDRRLQSALQAYLCGPEDGYRRSRIIQTVNDAACGDREAAARLPDIVPHGDFAFWGVAAALGIDALGRVAHHAFFGSLPAGYPGAIGSERRDDGPLRRLWLADSLDRRDVASLKAEPADLDAVTSWLRRKVDHDSDMTLDPFLVGQTIDIGSAGQKRSLSMIGFFEPITDHAWTGPEVGLLYISPGPGARRIVLSGHTLVEDVSVTITTHVKSCTRTAMEIESPGYKTFEIMLPDTPGDSFDTPLCLAIRNTGCIAPAKIGLSDDTRSLGYCIRKISIA